MHLQCVALLILVKLIKLFRKYITNYSFRMSRFKCQNLYNYQISGLLIPCSSCTQLLCSTVQPRLFSGFRNLPCVLLGGKWHGVSQRASYLPGELPLQKRLFRERGKFCSCVRKIAIQVKGTDPFWSDYYVKM